MIAALLEYAGQGLKLGWVMNLNWKRPLFYCLIPILIFLAFVGFPPPFAPPRATRPSQEQSVPADKKEGDTLR